MSDETPQSPATPAVTTDTTAPVTLDTTTAPAASVSAPTHSDTPAYEAPPMVVGAVEIDPKERYGLEHLEHELGATIEGLVDGVEAGAKVVYLSTEDRMAALEKHVANLFEAVKADLQRDASVVATDVSHVEAAVQGFGAHLKVLIAAGVHKVEDFFHLTHVDVGQAKSNDSETPAA